MKAIIRLLTQLHHRGGDICCLLRSIDSRLTGINTKLDVLLTDVQDDGTSTGTPENTSAIIDATASLKSHADALTSATTAAEASEQPPQVLPPPQP